MFVAFYLIIGVCAAFGLIQAAGPNIPPRPPVRPTPPATPTPRSTTGNSPNRTGSSQAPTTGTPTTGTPTTGQGATPAPAPAAAANDGTQSVNLFNDQVWLMDLFSEEGSNIGRFPEPITNSNLSLIHI